VLLGEALDMDDAALAKRLGVSRSTIHNYTSGKTSRVKITLAQARVLVAEIDARTAKLRQAAEIFSQVRD
jgi:transcriptional regulator with XRE-family HTH domain